MLKRWMRLLMYRASSGLFLYGNRARELLLKAGFPAEKMCVVYNSLRYGEQKHFRESIGTAEVQSLRHRFLGDDNFQAGRILLFCGRLKPSRNIEMICDSIVDMRQMGVYCALIVVGEGDAAYKAKCLAHVVRNGSQDQVHFLGAVYDESELSQVVHGIRFSSMPRWRGTAGNACVRLWCASVHA